MAETDKSSTPTDNTAQPQPGAVIAPGSAEQSPQVSPPIAETPPPPTAPEPVQPQALPEQVPTQPFSVDTPAPAPSDGDISWTASEFVAHDKSAEWYTMLAFIALVAATAVFILTKDKVSAAVVIVGALFLGIYGARRPRQLQYRLDSGGISIGDKHHTYEEFRSFAIVPEGAFSSIVFMPLKRFATQTIIYYAPEDEDKIVDLLANRLPFEEHGADAVDRLMRRIRF